MFLLFILIIINTARAMILILPLPCMYLFYMFFAFLFFFFYFLYLLGLSNSFVVLRHYLYFYFISYLILTCCSREHDIYCNLSKIFPLGCEFFGFLFHSPYAAFHMPHCILVICWKAHNTLCPPRQANIPSVRVLLMQERNLIARWILNVL